MIYVALLRGVNVGGKSMVSMAALKACFEALGFDGIKTYINSGNIIFSTGQVPTDMLAGQIEATLDKTFNPGIRVLVKTHEELQELAAAIPANWTNDAASRCDVMFLWPTIDKPETLQELPAKPELEELDYLPGAVVWYIDRSRVTESHMPRIIGTSLYKQITIRNINTVRKLITLANNTVDGPN